MFDCKYLSSIFVQGIMYSNQKKLNAKHGENKKWNRSNSGFINNRFLHFINLFKVTIP